MSQHTGSTQSRPLYGVLLVMVAVFVFALSDAVTKHLASQHPVPLVMAVRYFVNLGLLAAILAPRMRAQLWQTRRTHLVLLRGLCLAAASLTMGLALRLMPVGETVAIVYLSPFAVMLLATPLLGEKALWANWVGSALGFAGVLLIVRPGSGLDAWGVTFALINAALATAYHLLTRLLVRTETTAAMLFQTSLVGALVFGGLTFTLPDLTMPPLGDLYWMLVLGALSVLGHYLFTLAYRYAPTTLLAPVNYLHLVWAGGLGWIAFDHVPDGWSMLGMALICTAGVGVALHAHVVLGCANCRDKMAA
jgi:drug/metabolite transporter (DMT)-like permease